MKKKLLYIAAVIICLSIITGGTFAYFTTDEIAHNVITTKRVKVDILNQQEINGKLEDAEIGIPIMPSSVVSKVVSACVDEAIAWVRVKYEISAYDANGKVMSASNAELKEIVLIEENDSDWIEKDGWWYYKKALGDESKNGKTSAPLFEQVEFSGPKMGNEYQNGTIEIHVTAQAVQKANNGSSVLEAAGWPEE